MSATTVSIFDMDGVLIDSGAHHRQAWRALLDELGVEPAEPDFWRLTIGRPAEEAVPLLLGRALPPAEARRLALRKRALYAEYSAQGVLPVAGVERFVDSLAHGGVPRAVATSASRHDAESLLSEVGLRAQFAVVVTVDDVALGKPDPGVYLEAARRLRVAADACLVFEDSVVGIRAARRAGMRAVGVTTAHTAEELTAAGAESAIADFAGIEWSQIARR